MKSVRRLARGAIRLRFWITAFHFCIGILICNARLYAITDTWVSFTNNSLWSNGSNWIPGIPNSAGTTADFSTLNITSDLTVNLDSSFTVGNLILGDTTTSNDWTLANNGNVANILTLDNTGGSGAPKITVKPGTNASNNTGATISAVLAGTQGVILVGGGGSSNTGANLVLSGANTYTGGTTINSLTGTQTFTVFAANNSAFGTGDVHFNPGTSNFGRMVIGGGVVISNNIFLDTINGPTGGNGAISVGSLTAFGGTTITNNQNVTATINGVITVNSRTLSGGTFDGAMPTTNSAAYGSATTTNFLILNGAINDMVGGTLGGVVLSKSTSGGNMNGLIHRGGNVQYAGGGSYYRLEERAGVAQVGATDGIATNAYIDIGGNAGTGNNPSQYALLDLNGNTQHLVGITNYLSNSATTTSSGSATVTNTSTTTAATLILTPVASSNTLQSNLWFTGGVAGIGANASITNSSTAAPLNLTMNGSSTGIQYLTTLNAYTGVTTLTSGTLAISSLANGGIAHNLTTTNGSTTATVDDPTGLVVGQTIVGAGVRTYSTNNVAPTTISAISGNTITLSVAATASGANTTQFGTANGLGISSNAASNLVFNGGTLSYINNLDSSNSFQFNTTTDPSLALTGVLQTTSTDRNFTINNGSSGTIDVQNFTNTSNVTSPITVTMSGTSANTTGTLNKTGPGTLILTGVNQHTGGTNVNGGSLLVNSPGKLSTGPVSVASLATLGGNGTIGGTVTPLSGGIIAPGNPSLNSGVGTLTVAGLTLNTGAVTNFEFGTGNDQITVSNSGGLTINGGNVNLFNAGTTTAFSTDGTYTLMNISGTIGGALSNLTVTNPTAGKFYNLTATSSIVQLVIGDASTAEWSNTSGDGKWTTGGAGGNWVDANNNANFVAVPNAVGVTAKFGTLSGGNVDLNGNKTVSGLIFSGSGYTLAGTSSTLTLNNGAAASAVTVSGGTNTIAVPVSLAKASSITFSNNSSLTFSGAISGGQPLSMVGAGTLTLTANNSYSSTAINASTLNVGTFGGTDTTGSLGSVSGSNDVTMSNAATLNFNLASPVAYSFSGGIVGSGVSAATINQLGTGSTTIGGSISNVTSVNVQAGSLTVSGGLGQSGGVNVTGSGGLGNTGSGSLTVGGTLSGIGALNVDTTGTVTLNGAGAWGGGTNINHGTVILNNASAFPTSSVLGINGGTLDLHGNSISLSNMTGTTAGGIITNNGPSNSVSNISFSGNTANYDLFAALNDGTGKVSFTTAISNLNTFNVPAWTVHFHATGTYTGGTTVNSQSIEADANNAFGTGPITVVANNTSTNWSSIYIAPGVTINNNITIQQAKPTAGTPTPPFGAIQQTASGGNATVQGSVTILADDKDGGLFQGPVAGGSDFLNINGPVIAGGTATTIIQSGGNVKYGDTTGTSSYQIIQVNGQADLGTNNALCQTAVMQLSTSTTGNASSGTFDLNGFNQTIAGLSDAATLTGTVQNSGTGTNTLTINATGTNTYNGNINNGSGSVNLTIGGTGTQILVSSNSNYTGVTTFTGSGIAQALDLENGNSPSSIGAANNSASNLVFDGGTLQYTGTSSKSIDRGFTINSGKTAHLGVMTAGVNLTLTGSNPSSTGGFEKTGPGTLTFDTSAGTYGYTGATTISGGTLIVNNQLTNTSSVSIGSGAVLAGSGSIGSPTSTFNHTAGTINPGVVGGASAGILTIGGNLTLAGGGVTYDIDDTQLGNQAAQDLVKVIGAFNVTAATPVVLDFLNPGASPTAFSYKLFQFGSTTVTNTILQNDLSFSTNLIAGRLTATPILSGNTVVINVTVAPAAVLTWNSTSSGAWDTSTANWFNTGTSASDKFVNGDQVTFADLTHSGSTPQNAITISGTLSPSAINITSNTVNYTFSGAGSIAGSGTLNISGNSTTTIKTNNSYSGGTNITSVSATVDVGGSGTSGLLGTGDVLNNGTLKFTRTDGNAITPVTFVNNINGTGNLINTCPGTTIMSGNINQNSVTLNGSGGTTLSNSVTTTAGVAISGNTNATFQGSVNAGTTVGVSGTAGVTMANVSTGSGLNVSGSANVNISGGLNGAGGIAMTSSGSLTLAGGSGYDGSTVISAGTFFPNDASAFGDTTGTTTVNAGGSIFAAVGTGIDYGSETITINGTGNGTSNNGALHAGGSTTQTFENTITLGSDSLVNVDGGATLALTAATNGTALAGAHNLSVAGPGTLLIGGNVNVTSISTSTTAGAAVTFAPQALATITIASAISGSSTLNINTAGTPAAGSLGTTVFSGNNSTFTGAINVNSGNLQISTATQLGNGTGAVTLTGGAGAVNGTLVVATGSTASFANPLTFGGRQAPNATVPHIENVSGNNTFSGSITLTSGGNDYVLQSDGGSLTLQGNIGTASITSGGNSGARRLDVGGAGNGALNGVLTDVADTTPGNDTTGNPIYIVKSGSGAWTLGASSSVNGGLTINDSGKVVIAAGKSVSFAGGLALNNPTAGPTADTSPHLSLGTGTDTGSNLTVNGATWGTTGTVLHIDNWTYGAGASGDHVNVGTTAPPTSAQLQTQIQFTDFSVGASLTTTATAARAVGEITPLIGDVNQDGHVDAKDISALLKALADVGSSGTSDVNSYAHAHPSFTNSDILFALDVDGDGKDTNADIQSLINYLIAGNGSTAPVPEPSSFILLAICGLTLLRFQRSRSQT